MDGFDKQNMAVSSPDTAFSFVHSINFSRKCQFESVFFFNILQHFQYITLLIRVTSENQLSCLFELIIDSEIVTVYVIRIDL